MTAQEIISNLIPSEQYLEVQYESLNANQKRFADWLIEEKWTRFSKAIEIASKVKKWDHNGRPRQEKVERMYNAYKWYLKTYEDTKEIGFSELVRFKNFLNEYYDLDQESRMAVYILIGDNSPEKSLEHYQVKFQYITKTYIGADDGRESIMEENGAFRLGVCKTVGEEFIKSGGFEMYIGAEDNPIAQNLIYEYVDPEKVTIQLQHDGRLTYETNPDWYEDTMFENMRETYFYLSNDF